MRVVLALQPDEPGRVHLHDRARKGGPWQGPPHRHDELEWNLVVRGRAAVLVVDQRFELTPGAMLWLFPGQDHVVAEQSPDFAMWVVVFRQKFVREWTAGGRGELARRLPSHTRCRVLSGPTATMLEALCAENATTDPAGIERRAGLAFLLVGGWRIAETAGRSSGPRTLHPAVARAARILQERPTLESLALLGREAGLSGGRLSRLFHAQTGVSLSRFRSRERLRRFFALFDGGPGRTMLEAALEAGFRSYVQFYRTFRAETGRGPREYFHGYPPIS